MSFVGNCGDVAIVPQDLSYFLGPNVALIRVVSDFIVPSYLELFLALQSVQAMIAPFIKAVAQPSLSMGTIRQIAIAVPPVDEQLVILEQLRVALLGQSSPRARRKTRAGVRPKFEAVSVDSRLLTGNSYRRTRKTSPPPSFSNASPSERAAGAAKPRLPKRPRRKKVTA